MFAGRRFVAALLFVPALILWIVIRLLLKVGGAIAVKGKHNSLVFNELC